MKASGEQFDERIVEVHWDTELEGWRMMRFRDDKPNGNHKNVVENILISISDGIEKDEVSTPSLSSTCRLVCTPRPTMLLPTSVYSPLGSPPSAQLLSHSNTIRNTWKNRQSQAAATSAQRASNALPPKPPPPLPPSQSQAAPPTALSMRRYGPIAPSAVSKVAGPEVIAGLHR